MIQQDGIYTSKQIISALGISSATLQKWIQKGLRFSKRDTKSRYFLGRHIFEFLFEVKS